MNWLGAAASAGTLVCLVVGGAVAQEAGGSHEATDSAAVAATVDAYHAALGAGDTAAVRRLLHEDVMVLESGGLEDRAEYFSHHLPADMAFAEAVPRERGPIQVSVRNDVAWAVSTSETRGEFRGRQIDSVGAELMVLVREGGEWRIVAIHSSSRQRAR